MNISKHEQRVLHVLAQGGEIRCVRSANGKVLHAQCVTRDGLVLADFPLALFARLLRRRFIHSAQGRPYRATWLGRASVRAQPDNR